MVDRLRDDRVLRIFRIESDSGTPPSRQVHDAAIAAVRDGRLTAGDRLPPVRVLAEHLGLAANTVASAYRFLEESGVTEGRGRAGTFVRGSDDPVLEAAQRTIREAVERLRQLGLEPQHIHDELLRAAQSLRTSSSGTIESPPPV